MPKFSRWIAALLTACILMNLIPVSAFAQALPEETLLLEEKPQEPSETETTLIEEEQPEEEQTEEEQPEEEQSEDDQPEDDQPEDDQPEDDQPEDDQPEEDQPEENQPAEDQTEEGLLAAAQSGEDSPEEMPEQVQTLEEADTSGITDPFAVHFAEVLDNNDFSGILSQDENGGITLKVGDGESLGLLAEQQPVTKDGTTYFYQNWTFEITATGALSLPDDFQGLGTETYPFSGKITGETIPIKTEKTIFKALSTEAELNNSIEWSGTTDQPILTKVLVADGDGSAAINMPLDSASTFSPFIGQLKGTQEVILPKLNYSGAEPNDTDPAYPSNAGILCGSMDADSRLQISASDLILPTEQALTLKAAENGNVGGLVGSMDSGAKLTVTGDGPLALNVNLIGSNAGGLVGYADSASVVLNAPVTIDGELSGTGSVGAIAGETTSGKMTGSITVGAVNITSGVNVGILYGSYTTSEDVAPMTGVSFAEGTRQVSGTNCGGIFGTLTLNGDAKCTVSEADISTTLKTATNYGGIVGTLNGGRQNALIVDSTTVTTNGTGSAQYLGGIVGIQNATLDAKNSTATVGYPNAIATSGFGGLSAKVSDRALLIADTMTVSTEGKKIDGKSGGGVAGSTGAGSIVWLKTSLDMTQCALTKITGSGQIVGKQDCSLIYAPNVEISRHSDVELDDIGNYGELYRIEDFLNPISATYETTFTHSLGKTDGVYVLSSPLDYACLALAWQSRGAFDTVSDINTWEDLKTCTIKLGDDLENGTLDLTGCGIGGLTRDVSGDSFSGTFNGNHKTLKLDIGAENNANGVSKGDGRIYWHNATGLFAELTGNAQVTNLTLAGSIRVSNNVYTSPMYCGGLAARLSATDPIANVSTKVSVDAQCNSSYQMYIGGLFGFVTKAVTRLTIDSEQDASIEATYSGSGNASFNHIGGVIGAIEGSSGIFIECSGDAALTGSIECKTSKANNYVGGLIGTIFKDGSPTVTLSSLNVHDFTLTGTATARMGGILGCIWADTTVNIDSLTVTNSTLTASGKDVELGGLVYRASGKWTVRSVDMSGLTIDAAKAKALGLMVCKGGPFKENINQTDTNYTNIDGLYLEMSTGWEEGYKVPADSATITCGDNTVFDEFVAYTAYADRTNNTPDYQITANGSGIISLKADKNDEGHLITYVNRTTVVQSKQTNLYSRYYYNLPDMTSDDGAIDTPQELLIWSVNRYAADNLKKYFPVTGDTISGILDMKGLSYYPIDITNGDVTVQNATVKFYNKEIEALETNNKSTRGTDDSHSQHYTMHCGLFLNFTADKNKEGKTYTMTVNGVSFAGTVGVVNGKSGALVCGTVAGELYNSKDSICRVILAEEDAASKAVTLDGISVEPSGADIRPVLIGSMGDYVELSANYLTTTDKQGKNAGTSLIGDVGNSNAASVTVALAGTIKLPDTKGVFTEATLFNSLQYTNGSATYVFDRAKDYPEYPDPLTYDHNATYGSELSSGVSVEYFGKEGYYNDWSGEGYFISADGNLTSHNDFSGYLPYVRSSPAVSKDEYSLEKGWHELAVNVRYVDVKGGCGTYGDPYLVNEENVGMLKDVAKYINTGIAAKNWTVVVPKDGTYHTDSGEDITLRFNGTTWVNDDNEPYDGDVRTHLANAYYCFEADVPLNDFQGFGSGSMAFSGVITGKKADGLAPTVTLSGATTGLINYSYGSVVRDLNVTLTQTVDLSRGTWVRGNAETAPATFFGGVIGCVMGGDNIIENVAMTVVKGFDVKKDSHLIPVGGYVGVIAGGGVIFRGSCSGGITEGDTFYHNSIIGRVLGGYAFYEGTDSPPVNTGTDYKINKLYTSETPCLTWNNGNLTVNDGQGLLILSGIISSGAGNVNSVAYAKGKARLAKYDGIGAENPDDYDKAALDDAGSQFPYLLSTYVSGGNPELCGSGDSNAIKITLSSDIDMTGYDNGYRGLSARYVSNAAFNVSTNGVDADLVVMRVSCFDGHGKTVSNINMNVQEYEDDDFHAASLGGIFNIVWTQSGGGEFAKNLTLDSCTVSLAYKASNGNDRYQATTDTLWDEDGRYQATTDTLWDEDGRSSVAVGGFIGSVSDLVSDVNIEVTTSNYLLEELHIRNSTIEGPNSAGGFIGATSMTNETMKDRYPGKLLSNGVNAQFGPSFLNCSYYNIRVTAMLAAGGFVGCVYAQKQTVKIQFVSMGIAPSSSNAEKKGCYATCTVTKNLTVGEGTTSAEGGANCKILTKARGGVSGGLFGVVCIRTRINSPDVNGLTGLSVLSEADKILPLCLQNVTIGADATAGVLTTSGSGNNGLLNGSTTVAGGCIGRIGGANPVYIHNVTLDDCKLNGNTIQTNYIGGIVGYGHTNTRINMDKCAVVNAKVTGQCCGGLLGYGGQSNASVLNASNCKITGSELTGLTTNAYAGGLIGYAYNNFNLFGFNILIKDTQITANNSDNNSKAGRLIGYSRNTPTVNASGISACVTKSQIADNFPTRDIGNTTSYTGYIAYADYAGTDAKVDGYEMPYVVANPNHELDGTNILTGDAVGSTSIGKKIWADHQAGVTSKTNYAPYGYVDSMVTADSTAAANMKGLEISTFRKEQGCGPDDLPVLLLKDGNTDVILNYLDVITNGGYTTAKNITTKLVDSRKKEYNAVDLSVSVYYYDDETEIFAEKPDKLSDEPQSIYLSSDGKLKVNVKSYDNQRKRFTLIEAVFTTVINGTAKQYTVSIPVIVVRKLEYIYSATFSYGKEFRAETYNTLTNHLLESTGTPFTAYITYQYNRAYVENKLVYAEYDWQGYMDGGGDMLGVDKQLTFSCGELPEKTQLTLLDCQNGNKAYYYTTGKDDGSTVKLSQFKSLDDDTAFCSSMAEILKVTAVPMDGGKYVIGTKDDATIRLKENGSFTYYRPAKEYETGAYNLTVPTNLKDWIPTENYFLVITIPEQTVSTFNMNGALRSNLVSEISSNGTKLLRNGGTVDGGSSTVSTYQISFGYRQELTSLAEEGQAAIDLMDTDNIMKVQVKDTITFFDQVYTEQDGLYLKFSVGLRETIGRDTKEVQFPQGTEGTVRFYVQDASGNYYSYSGGTWSRGDKTKLEAASYEWSFDPKTGSMNDLPLSRDGKTPLDLAQVRTIVKGSNSNQIIVTAEMDIPMDETLLRATVPTSDRSGVDNYVKLHYLAQISTTPQSLDYSAARATKDDNASYYLGVSYIAVLSMDATNISQLGINPLAKIDEYLTEDGKSKIDCIIALDLENTKDMESVLQHTNSITFKLSLSRRGETSELENGGDYISFRWPDDKTDWDWTISQNAYYDPENNSSIVSEFFNGKQFTIPLTAYVSMDIPNYANYQVKVQVTFNGINTENIPDVYDKNAKIVYTYACIRPKFYNPSGNST